MSAPISTRGAADAEADQLWAEEPSHLAGHARIRARIAGLHCSLCTGTIEKALSRQAGVEKVAVSLTHEQALVDYDPALISPQDILTTLRDIGYDLYDPRKLRPFEDEEADLVREGIRLLAAAAASLVSIALILDVSGLASILVPASVVALMVPVSYAILRPAGRARAALGAAALITPAALAYLGRQSGLVDPTAVGWLTGALALIAVFGIGPHILQMAYQAARRRILNQHVLLEVGAFAGIAGGLIGLTGALPDYPTAAFFAVTVLVMNYHIFSEWLSLLVKTRSSQAVRKLLDLQPDTARLVRDGTEQEVALSQVVVGDARSGDRHATRHLDGQPAAELHGLRARGRGPRRRRDRRGRRAPRRGRVLRLDRAVHRDDARVLLPQPRDLPGRVGRRTGGGHDHRRRRCCPRRGERHDLLQRVRRLLAP